MVNNIVCMFNKHRNYAVAFCKDQGDTLLSAYVSQMIVLKEAKIANTVGVILKGKHIRMSSGVFLRFKQASTAFRHV